MKMRILLLLLVTFLSINGAFAQRYSQEDLKNIAADFLKRNAYTADTTALEPKRLYRADYEVRKKRDELIQERFNMLQPTAFAINSKGNKWYIGFEFTEEYKEKNKIKGKVGRIIVLNGQARIHEVLPGEFQFE